MTVTSRRWPRFALALALGSALTTLSWGQVGYEHDYPAPEPGTYDLPAIKAAADGKVLGADGKARRLSELLRGHVTILSFIYTRCADPTACPHASGVLYQIHQQTKSDPALARDLQLLTFSFDPEHDTPQVMARYGDGLRGGGQRDDVPGSPWHFLTTAGSRDLKPILEAYGQRVDRKKSPDDPLGPLNHLVRVYLIDENQRIRNIYSFGLMDPRLLLADVRTLLRESRGRASAG